MGPKMTLESSRGLFLYLETLRVALADEIVTDEEASILEILAKALGLPSGAAGDAVAILDGHLANPITPRQQERWNRREVGDASLYQAALIAALDDEVITEDEWAMLEHLRRALGIQRDEHALIEESIRSQNQGSEAHERRLVRLERYLELRTTF